MCAAQGPGEAGAPVWSPAVVLDTEARGAGVLELQGHVDAEQGNMEAGTRDQEAGPPPRQEHRMGVGHRGGACGCRFKGPGAEGGPTKPSWTPSLAFPAPCGAQYQLPFDWNFLGGTSVVCIQRITDQIREKHYFQISIIKHPKELSKYLL